MENILILDTETTGLDPNKGSQIIEIGALLYNVKHRVVLQSLSTLFPCEENPVEDINHISAESTRENYCLSFIPTALMAMADTAQACLAHNAQFDKKFIRLLGVGHHLLSKKWICTKDDFKWPVPLYRTRLEDICTAMGVPYVNAHRALNDCAFLAACLSRVEDLSNRLNSAGERNNFDRYK